MAEMTTKQAIARVRSLSGTIDRAIMRGIKEALADGLEDAREMSAGPFSSRELKRMDHPYATRHGSPMLPPEVVNLQSGEFYHSWWTRQFADGGQLRNDSKVADFLQYGTETMFARPIAEKLGEKLADHAERRLNEEGRKLDERYG